MSDLCRIICGDCRDLLYDLDEQSVQCVVTSPPYWNLRNYSGGEKEIGVEKLVEEYVSNLVSIFRLVWPILHDTGTVWLNLGDVFAGGGNGGGGSFAKDGIRCALPGTDKNKATRFGPRGAVNGVKPKDLIGIPWMVALALRADGWYLRQWMPWVKRNAMPESVQDRPCSSCETVFLLTKQADYFYDAVAVRKPPSEDLLKQVRDGYNGSATKDFAGGNAQDASATKSRVIDGMRARVDKQRGRGRRHDGFNNRWDQMTKEEQQSCGSSRRNGDWFFDSLKGMLTDEDGVPLAFNVGTHPFKGAHFATFPADLIRPMILAGTSVAGCCPICSAPWARITVGWEPTCEHADQIPIPCTVLDPFGGACTTGLVANELSRRSILLELNPEYCELGRRRLSPPPAAEAGPPAAASPTPASSPPSTA